MWAPADGLFGSKCDLHNVFMKAIMNIQAPYFELLGSLKNCYLLKKASALWTWFFVVFNEYDS
jgi:hypothetical protein